MCLRPGFLKSSGAGAQVSYGAWYAYMSLFVIVIVIIIIIIILLYYYIIIIDIISITRR